MSDEWWMTNRLDDISVKDAPSAIQALRNEVKQAREDKWEAQRKLKNIQPVISEANPMVGDIFIHSASGRKFAAYAILTEGTGNLAQPLTSSITIRAL